MIAADCCEYSEPVWARFTSPRIPVVVYPFLGDDMAMYANNIKNKQHATCSKQTYQGWRLNKRTIFPDMDSHF